MTFLATLFIHDLRIETKYQLSAKTPIEIHFIINI